MLKLFLKPTLFTIEKSLAKFYFGLDSFKNQVIGGPFVGRFGLRTVFFDENLTCDLQFKSRDFSFALNSMKSLVLVTPN